MKPSTSIKEWEIGPHRATLESEDLLHIVFREVIGRSDAETVKKLTLDLGDQYGKLYVIIDIGQFTSIEAGARAAWTHMERPWPIKYLLSYGGAFWARTLAMTVNRAGRLLAPSHFSYDYHAVATEAEARRLVQERRERLAA